MARTETKVLDGQDVMDEIYDLIGRRVPELGANDPVRPFFAILVPRAGLRSPKGVSSGRMHATSGLVVHDGGLSGTVETPLLRGRDVLREIADLLTMRLPHVLTTDSIWPSLRRMLDTCSAHPGRSPLRLVPTGKET